MLSSTQLVEYNTLREEVVSLFAQLPRGSRTQASYDLRLSQSIISSVVSGRWVDEARLKQIKQWAEARLAERKAVAS